MVITAHHQVLIIGGGTAGITVAARLKQAGIHDIGLLDPATTHYYQPLWTLVGGGRAPVEESARPERSVMPKGVTWIRERAEDIDPDEQTVSTDRRSRIGYVRLIVCPGIQLDWHKVPGMAEGINTLQISSNYRYNLAPKTWELIHGMREARRSGGRGSGRPSKCASSQEALSETTPTTVHRR
jgi:sulfide:quinone oxidoreductase